MNDSSGKTLLGFKLDPYERSFRLVRLHVLRQSAVQWTIGFFETCRKEICWPRSLPDIVSLVSISLATRPGFVTTPMTRTKTEMMGDEIKLGNEVRLTVGLPVAGRIVLLKDGVVVQDQSAVNKMEFVAREKGSYRVEVYLPQLPKPAGDQPWIISNPIYVR